MICLAYSGYIPLKLFNVYNADTINGAIAFISIPYYMPQW